MAKNAEMTAIATLFVLRQDARAMMDLIEAATDGIACELSPGGKTTAEVRELLDTLDAAPWANSLGAAKIKAA